MKVFVHVSLIAACLIVCAHSLPNAARPDLSVYDLDEPNMGIPVESNYFTHFTETFNRLRHNLLNYFWNLADPTNFKIPDGANTTSTTKIVDGHVVTINETTYTSGDDTSGTSFRIRIIDVRPQNDSVISDNSTPTQSAETIEDNNEIPKQEDTLTA